MIATNLSVHQIAPQPLPLERVARRIAPAFALLLGAATFMPYPAVPIGHQSALQIGNILSLLLLLPALAMSWRHRPLHVYLLILAPLVLSAVKVGLTQYDDLDLCIKDITTLSLTCLTVIVVQLYAPHYSLEILTGIALMTLVHVFVGFCQIYSFTQQEFPFAGVYINQSFFGVQDITANISRYIQRPFGFFPEPSAMASSLAPWVLFWVAELGGLVRLKRQPAPWQRTLFGFAAFSGLTLIILSSSGHTVITLAGLLFIGMLWLSRLRATPRTFALLLPTLCVFLPLVIWLAWTFMSNRIDGELHKTGSWEERSESMMVGLSLWAHGDWPTLIFGLGCGQSSVAVEKVSGFDCVWSVLLCYLYETGLIGAIATGAIGICLLRVWRSIRLNLVFAVIVIVWLVGITLTTSYAQLLPIWVTLGWLTIWPAVCAPADSRTDLSIEPRWNSFRRSSVLSTT